ncbi:MULTISPECIES: diguanylate cyclase [unclassified Mesorhizobium]|uniref:diguanylate cyclase n=1 Tax=unclassified Mesorhizobium TaxID=325217 RepID=UPI00112B0FDF|nr:MULTISPECIES: diguanylate cyclase [unclassified Mesorhizobium]TPI44957.1 diguanylate cyclase [Mesorhizobium sp. B3-1-1]TPJ57115.1 diguanylate cyclase [Mesorhizobium sp. B2-6-7]TPJ75531.1 diguanylate cyclase [Mesorhizobium sp. B2-6-3]TPJ90208.1 diguanylate cyclase [Mesorhizobium sp. B2-5-10]TPK03013.1 diguanylate cyclase [Mesorhizobium sp. B2-5-11]
MTIIGFHSEQSLNAYHEMLDVVYGQSQNYSKSKFEVLSHLSEVCGIAGKYIVKKPDITQASRFVPKIFGWACALFKSISPQNRDVEQVILRKFPGVCPYCLRAPCECWNLEKPTLDEAQIRAAFYKNAGSQRRTINDFELMFSQIYRESWINSSEFKRPVIYAYCRLIEELAELSEAVRFYHLYPVNFENEIADFFAWWFALSSLIREEQGEAATALDTMLWRSYPGHCRDCESAPCFCQQGPVRELMSKPAPGQLHYTDALTGLRNQASYEKDLKDIEAGRLALPVPLACIRTDVDKFKAVNDTHGHPAGDAALKHIAAMMRGKARMRDRLYRISGDEFGLLLPDCTEEEAFGLMRRVSKALREGAVRWTGPDGRSAEFNVSISVGVAECADAAQIQATFQKADDAAYRSKESGRDTITRASG